MNYTVLSAQYANAENTAAVVQTAEAGAVLASTKDTPALWAALTDIAPYSVVVSVPQTVTRFQALAALHLAGKLTAVQAIMAAPETPVLAKLAWDNALSFERNSPTLASLAAMLGMTDADLDALFTQAATIEA